MRTTIMLTVLASGAFMPEAGAQDAMEGFAASARCVACHGVAGITPNPTFPNLAGQNAAYLAMQLERFRTGQRYDPLMTPIAQSLTDHEIDSLARYFAGLGGTERAAGVQAAAGRRGFAHAESD